MNKIKGVVEDNTIVRLEIPYKFVNSIITDINELFKNKDKSGKHNIGASFGTIEMMETLKILKERYEFDQRMEVKRTKLSVEAD